MGILENLRQVGGVDSESNQPTSKSNQPTEPPTLERGMEKKTSACSERPARQVYYIFHIFYKLGFFGFWQYLPFGMENC